jgi:WD40 repeat protein
MKLCSVLASSLGLLFTITASVRSESAGVPVPPGARARLGVPRWLHGDTIATVAYSPDGKLLATGSADGWVALWETATGRLVQRLGGEAAIESLAFAPNGKLLAAVCGQAEVAVWDVATARKLHALAENGRDSTLGRHDFLCVTFAPDSRAVAVGKANRTVLRWDTTTGKQFPGFGQMPDRAKMPDNDEIGNDPDLPGDGDSVVALAFAPDGKRLAGAVGPTVVLWDTATTKELRALQTPTVRSVVFSPDGKLLAAGDDDGTIRLWDPASGKEVRAWSAHRGGVEAVAFSPDSRCLASGGHDANVRIWEAATGQECHCCGGHLEAVFSVAFAPDGRSVASGSGDQTYRVWDVRSGRATEPMPGHSRPVSFVGFTEGSRTLLSAGQDGMFRTWDVARGLEVRHWSGPALRSAVALLPDGKTVAAGGDGDHPLTVWDVAQGRLLRQQRSSPFSERGLAYSPDGRLLASAGFLGYRPAPPPPRRIQRMLREGGGSLYWNVYVRDAATGRLVAAFERRWCTALAFAPDSRMLAIACMDSRQRRDQGVICLRQADTGALITEFETGRGRTELLAFSPDGKLLAAAAPNRRGIQLWEVATGRVARVLGVDPGRPASLAFSPDGRLLAEARGTEVRVWQVATGREVQRFGGHDAELLCVAFSSDGTALASGSRDTTVIVWDVTKARPELLPAAPLSAQDLDVCWQDLGSEDAMRAFVRAGKLATIPEQSVPFLRQRLLALPGCDPQRLGQLVADLDNPGFAVRQHATTELQKLGDSAAPALRQLLQGRPSLEVTRRAEGLLKDMEVWRVPAPAQLRILRATQVLEQLGGPEARRVLEELGRGSVATPLSWEARAACERLRRTRPSGAGP